MNTLFSNPMKPMNFIERNKNIMSGWLDPIYNIFILKTTNFNTIRDSKYFYITFFIIFLCSISYSQESRFIKNGSVFLCVVRNDTVWLGVDSKIYHRSTPICKIFRAKNFVFASVGIFEIKQSGIAFNIDTTLQYCLRHEGFDFYKTMWYFKKICNYYVGLFGVAFDNTYHYPIGTKILDASIKVLFATYKSGKAKVFTYDFSPLVTKSQIIAVPDSESIIGTRGNWSIAYGGEVDKIYGVVPQTLSNDMPTVIKHLIGIEIDAMPEKVGYPINIIRIDKGGIHSIEKHQPCK